MSYITRFPSEHGTNSADKESASLHQTVIIGPGLRNRGTAVGNFDLQQQVATPRQEACRNNGININGKDRRENGEGVTRGTVKYNERCNDSVDEVMK